MVVLSLLTYITGGLGLALVLAIGVEEFRINSFRAEVAEARQETADARDETEKVNAIFSQNDAKNERARADNERMMREEADRIQSKANTLQATLNQNKRDYDAKAAELRKIIANAKDSDKSPLGAAMLRYFAGLRDQQQARSADNHASP